MSRKALVVPIVAALAAIALAVWWMAREPSPPARVPAPSISELAPRARTPEDLARAACVRLELATQAVQADGPAATVRQELAAARVLAAEAMRRDASFAELSGGIAALDEAVRRDEPEAAGLGLRIAAEQCGSALR